MCISSFPEGVPGHLVSEERPPPPPHQQQERGGSRRALRPRASPTALPFPTPTQSRGGPCSAPPTAVPGPWACEVRNRPGQRGPADGGAPAAPGPCLRLGIAPCKGLWWLPRTRARQRRLQGRRERMSRNGCFFPFCSFERRLLSSVRSPLTLSVPKAAKWPPCLGAWPVQSSELRTRDSCGAQETCG